jgi:hypothetical protein
MSCELMKNSSNQYITCFCGDMPEMYLFVFNATDYTSIHKLQKNVSDSYWGFGETIFSSNIMTKERDVAASCAMSDGNLICYKYNITSNYLESFIIDTNHSCGTQQLDFDVEYFPERKEFVFICRGYKDSEFYLARLSIEGNFEYFNEPFYLINTTKCGLPGRFNLYYSSKEQKYSIFTDTPCQTVYYFNTIDAPKIYDYPIDEPYFPFCKNYAYYNNCIQYIPNGYYLNHTYDIILGKCHDNCETCIEGPTFYNNNCLTCKYPLRLHSGNCINNCSIGCEYCTEYGLCLQCNNNAGYYPIYNNK